MSIKKVNSQKKVSEYIKKYLEDKDAFENAIRKGLNLEKVAKERGVKLVQPI